VSDAAHLLHDQHIESRQLAEDLAKEDGLVCHLRKGKVIATATDGLSCSVDMGSSGVAIPGVRFLASYTPGVGHYVWLLQAGPILLVIGKLP
jgi:hypothetical protein